MHVYTVPMHSQTLHKRITIMQFLSQHVVIQFRGRNVNIVKNGRNRFLHLSLLKIWDFFHSCEKFYVFSHQWKKSQIFNRNLYKNLLFFHILDCTMFRIALLTQNILVEYFIEKYCNCNSSCIFACLHIAYRDIHIVFTVLYNQFSRSQLLSLLSSLNMSYKENNRLGTGNSVHFKLVFYCVCLMCRFLYNHTANQPSAYFKSCDRTSFEGVITFFECHMS